MNEVNGGAAAAGLQCPACSNQIRPTLENLLFDGGIVCVSCGLRLTIDQGKSQAAIDELRRYYEATRAAREMAGEDSSHATDGSQR